MTHSKTTQQDPYGYDAAAADQARSSQAKLQSQLREQTRLLTRAQERVKVHRAKRDRMIATVVSSAPDREDWYAHPGVLHRDAVMSAAGIKTSVELHRLMERYRKSLAKPKRRKK